MRNTVLGHTCDACAELHLPHGVDAIALVLRVEPDRRDRVDRVAASVGTFCEHEASFMCVVAGKNITLIEALPPSCEECPNTPTRAIVRGVRIDPELIYPAEHAQRAVKRRCRRGKAAASTATIGAVSAVSA